MDRGIDPRILGHPFALYLHLGTEVVLTYRKFVIPRADCLSIPVRKFRRGPLRLRDGRPFFFDRQRIHKWSVLHSDAVAWPMTQRRFHWQNQCDRVARMELTIQAGKTVLDRR